MRLEKLDHYLDELLSVSRVKDSSINGLQVGRRDKEVKSLALAVDANLATVKEAAKSGADLLLVHHGIFWGKSFALTDGDYEKIALLVGSDLPLYALHLPLDAHQPLGNNYQIALKLGLENLRPFGDYYGFSIGFSGEFAGELKALLNKVTSLSASVNSHIYGLSERKSLKIAVVSGKAGGDILAEFRRSDMDIFITGELEHSLYNTIDDHGLNVISLGHYESEKFGVQALGDHLKEKWGIPGFFISHPTGY